MKKNKKVWAIVIVVVLIIISFWAGSKYGEGKAGSTLAANRANFTQNGFGANGSMRSAQSRGGAGGGLINGQILSMDNKSVTVSLRGGGSKIVFYSPSTKVEKTVDGVTTDLATGKEVMVTGTANPDGSVDATSIQIRPAVVPAAGGSANTTTTNQ